MPKRKSPEELTTTVQKRNRLNPRPQRLVSVRTTKEMVAGGSAEAGGDNIQALQAKVQRLNDYIEELHAYLDRQGLLLKVPQSIRAQMLGRPGGAVRLAHAIRRKMGGIWERVEPSICDAKHTGVTSDDLSKAAAPLIAEIRKLSQMPDTEALELAWDVALDVAQYTMRSVGAGPHAAGFGDRPSDDLLDGLLCDFMEKRDERGGLDREVLRETIQKLEEQAKEVGDYGIEPWFPKSLAKLKELKSQL